MGVIDTYFGGEKYTFWGWLFNMDTFIGGISIHLLGEGGFESIHLLGVYLRNEAQDVGDNHGKNTQFCAREWI